jgi:hypothetical protein
MSKNLFCCGIVIFSALVAGKASARECSESTRDQMKALMDTALAIERPDDETFATDASGNFGRTSQNCAYLRKRAAAQKKAMQWRNTHPECYPKGGRNSLDRSTKNLLEEIRENCK